MFSNINFFVSHISNSFSFNLDIFETNVINLFIVVTVLVYYGQIVFPT